MKKYQALLITLIAFAIHTPAYSMNYETTNLISQRPRYGTTINGEPNQRIHELLGELGLLQDKVMQMREEIEVLEPRFTPICDHENCPRMGRCTCCPNALRCSLDACAEAAACCCYSGGLGGLCSFFVYFFTFMATPCPSDNTLPTNTTAAPTTIITGLPTITGNFPIAYCEGSCSTNCAPPLSRALILGLTLPPAVIFTIGQCYLRRTRRARYQEYRQLKREYETNIETAKYALGKYTQVLINAQRERVAAALEPGSYESEHQTDENV